MYSVFLERRPCASLKSEDTVYSQPLPRNEVSPILFEGKGEGASSSRDVLALYEN